MHDLKLVFCVTFSVLGCRIPNAPSEISFLCCILCSGVQNTKCATGHQFSVSHFVFLAVEYKMRNWRSVFCVAFVILDAVIYHYIWLQCLATAPMKDFCFTLCHCLHCSYCH